MYFCILIFSSCLNLWFLVGRSGIMARLVINRVAWDRNSWPFLSVICFPSLCFSLSLSHSLILHSYWCFSSSAKTQAWLDNATGTTGPSSFGNGVSTKKVTTTSYSSWCLKVLQWVFIPLQVFIYNFLSIWLSLCCVIEYTGF